MKPEPWPAVRAANRGWSVFPLVPAQKTPAVPDHKEADCQHGGYCQGGHKKTEQLAVSDPDKIFAHWPARSTGHGVACGPSNLVVVDLDTHGELPEEWQHIRGIVTGADVFAFLCEHAGLTGWPSTYTVLTPTGGMHLYYRVPEESSFRNTAGFLGPMIDTRAQGGYVVGGGSITSAGTYEVTDDGDAEPIPAWLAQALAPAKYPGATRPPEAVASGPGRLAALERTVAASQPGERTSVLVWAAFRLRDMIADGSAAELDGEHLVSAAVAAGIQGGEHYARGQVRSVLGRTS